MYDIHMDNILYNNSLNTEHICKCVIMYNIGKYVSGIHELYSSKGRREVPKRLKTLMNLPTNKEELIEKCREKGLNGYETEIIVRIYWKKQSLTYISYNMDFSKYGRAQKYYSVRSLNNFHKEAFLKLIS